MLSNEETKELEPKIRVMMIIVGALIMGLTSATVMLFAVRENPKFTQDLGMLPLLAIGFATIAFTASLVAGLIQKRQSVVALAKEVLPKVKISDGSLAETALPRYQTNLIIRCALIEGASFFNIMVYFIFGSVFNLAVVAIGLILLFLNMPFPNQVISKLEWLIDSAKEEKKLGL